jgi:hypothetical protein
MTRTPYFPGTPEMEQTPEGRARVGDVIHVKVSGFTGFGSTWTRGAEIKLSALDIGSSINREGSSWIDRELRHPDGRLGSGPWPEGLAKLVHGSPEWAEQREAARREAHARPASERLDALQRVREEFGESTPTNRTLNRAPNPTVRAAHEQDERIRQNALRSISRYTPVEREV